MNEPSQRSSPTLPVPLTSMVGRQRELGVAEGMVRDRQVRLVTLTGAPGTGKTRLAVALCHAVVDNFQDGIWFVPLAALERPDLVLPTIAQVLGVHQVGRRPLVETLHRALNDQRLLLVLDNFEHLLLAAPDVVELLTGCGGVTVLATSRAPLHVSGEQRFVVPPLEVPRLDALPGLRVLAHVPAVHLFVQRARAMRSDFSLTESNASAVAELTVRLDGLPLAIELAAARSAILDPSQLLGRLGERLAVLTDGPRDLPARQRTLHAAISWSYDLLPAREQRVFRRLAVFAGGCKLEAAEAVGGDPDRPSHDAVGAISSLVEQSLLQHVQQPGADARLSMSETIREYALAKLAESGEEELVREQHACYYLDLAERLANPQLDSPDGPALMLAADHEHDNLRVALRWHIDRGAADASLRLAAALWSFWEKRGHWAEGLRWLQLALDLTSGTARAARADALLGLAILHRERSEYAAAARAAAEALSLRRELGQSRPMTLCLLLLADLVALAGDPVSGGSLAAEALALRQREGDRRAIAWAHLVCGYIAAYQADFSGARKHYELGLAERGARCGDDELDPTLWHGLGAVLAGAGAHATARPLLEQAVALFRARGEVRGIARAVLSLGALVAQRGEADTGRAMLEDSLAQFRTLGEGAGVAVCTLLLGLALPLDMLTEIGEEAVRMWGRVNLGREMPALTDLAAWRVVEDLPTTTPRGRRAPDALTQRELAILKLLARRFTNREIADELVVSVRTVERHVANIYAKTGMNKRRQAITYVRQLGLSVDANPATLPTT